MVPIFQKRSVEFPKEITTAEKTWNINLLFYHVWCHVLLLVIDKHSDVFLYSIIACRHSLWTKYVRSWSACNAPGIRLLKKRNICIIHRTQKDSIRCYPFPLQKACVLTYNGSQAAVGGMFVVALTLEDFPAGTTNFGSVTPFSSIPLQFLAMVISNHTGHCDEKPVFTASTPKDGECSDVPIASAYGAVIEVQVADFSKSYVN